MEELKVSIIIPVYNVEQYIGNCLRSVMRQTYKGPMECLIIDDCGTDESIAVAEGMIREYNDNANVNLNANLDLDDNNFNVNGGGGIRFRILRHEHNRGLSAARNTGTEHATGEYIYYLDSDDEITDDCIEKLMAVALKDSAIEMVQGNTLIHPIQKSAYLFVGQIILQETVSNEEVRKCYYQYHQITCTLWNKLLRRDFIINNHLQCREGIIYEDVLWGFYLVKYLTKACFVSDITYHGKKRPGSITTETDSCTRMANHCVMYQDMLTHLTPKNRGTGLCLALGSVREK